jgi:hypothetical protein
MHGNKVSAGAAAFETHARAQRMGHTLIGFFIISGVNDRPDKILAALIGASSASICDKSAPKKMS